MPAFYNRATLAYDGATIDSNTVQGELSAALSIEKAAVQSAYRPGDAIAFAVTVRNAGATDANELVLTDDLGAYGFGARSLVPLDYVDGSARYYVDGEPQDAPAMDAGAALQFRGIRVPAGGSAMLLYAARANDFAPLGPCAAIASAATLDAAPAGASGLPISASAEVRPDPGARLSIHKSLSPARVSPGEPLTYTLTIENSGATPVSAEDGAAVTDRFEPRMDIASVRYNGGAWSAGANYAYDPASGLFSTQAGQLNVPAATYTQDTATGRWRVQPGMATIEITGTLR